MSDARPRLLLVDDEAAIRDSLAPVLERAGFAVTTASDGADALSAIRAHPPAIVVSDVLMPNLDGRELVRSMRRMDDWTPVLLLTQVGESFERSAALEEGADDYLGKPFDPAELVARVRAILRRSVPGARPLTAAERLQSGPLLVDRIARRWWLDGEELQLTPRAALLLDYLMTHPDELHSREKLLGSLWGYDQAVSSRAVDHRVAEIRRVLRDDAAEPRFVETVQSLGYRFRGAVAPAGPR